MIKLIDILKEEANKILVPRRSAEERQKNYLIATQKKIQQYIKNGGEGSLYLSNTPIKSLPDNLQVGGDLNLRNTQIRSLPDNLKVGGFLYLSSTPIKSLPDNLQVGGGLYLNNTPLAKKYTKEQIKQMVPGVKGNIYVQTY